MMWGCFHNAYMFWARYELVSKRCLGDLIKIATQNSHKKYVDDPMFLACFIEIGSVDFLTYSCYLY
jgi:hypothetical protein